MNIFNEHNFLLSCKIATENVLYCIDQWNPFEAVDNDIQIEDLKICVEHRIQKLVDIFKQKFGVSNDIEAEIIVRKMINKHVRCNLFYRLRSVWTRYKTIFKRKDFKLRYYNTTE